MGDKKIIEARAKDYVNFSYSTLKAIKKEVEGLVEKYGEDATIRLERDDYDDSSSLFLYHEREETDQEFKARLDMEAKNKKWRDEHDKREFERLKKLYGSE